MEWSESYTPNYFSLEDIISTQERIPCKFEVNVPGLGYLDQSKGSKDLISGNKLELPCWLAEALILSRRNIVSTQLPTTFRKNFREIFKADPVVVDLHKLGPYFYDLGLHILNLLHRESGDIATLLPQILRERLRVIMDSALHAMADDTSMQISNLDELERTLYKVGQSSLRDYELWIARKSHILNASELIQERFKRKFDGSFK